MRILPRVNEDVNEEWISDKTRHIVDDRMTDLRSLSHLAEWQRYVLAPGSRKS